MRKKETGEKNQILLSIAKLFESFAPERKEHYYQELFLLLQKIVSFENSSILYFNDSIKKLELISNYGEIFDLIEIIEFEFGKGLTSWLAREKKWVLLNNLKEKYAGLDSSKRISSFMSVPLILEKQMYGMINFSHSAPDAFSKENLHSIQLITPFIAALLSKNRYIETLLKQTDEILQMNEKMQQTHKELLELKKKEAVSATVCSLNHEINNPLMIISGNIQLLRATESSPKTLKKLEQIDNQISRITDILRQLREIESPMFEEYLNHGQYDQMLKLKK